MTDYTWYQTDFNVTISFRVDSDNYDAVDIACSPTNIRAGVRGGTPVIDGALSGSIDPASSKWGFMSSEGTGATFVQIMLGKAPAGPWGSLLADGSSPAPSRYVVTTYDYAAEEDTEIGFGPGDYIEVLSEDPSGWWQGSYYGFVGTFPSNFTEPLDPTAEIFYTNNDETFPLESIEPVKSQEEIEAEAAAEALARQQAEALAQQQTEAFSQPGTTIPVVPMGPDGKGYVRGTFDYEASDAGELGFHIGDIITVLSQDDSGWWQGELNGVKGWFPANFTEACPAPTKSAVPPVSVRNASLSASAPAGGTAALDEAIGNTHVETLTSFSRAKAKGRRPPRASSKLGASLKTRMETNDPVKGGDDDDDGGLGQRRGSGSAAELQQPSFRKRPMQYRSMMPGAPGMTDELQNLFNKGGKGPAAGKSQGPAGAGGLKPHPGPGARRGSGGEKPSGGLPFSVNLHSTKKQQPQPQAPHSEPNSEGSGLPFPVALRSSKKQQPQPPAQQPHNEPNNEGGLPFPVALRSAKKQQPQPPAPGLGPKPMPKGAPGVVVKSKPQAPGVMVKSKPQAPGPKPGLAPKPMPKGAPGVMVKSKPQAPGLKQQQPQPSGEPVPVRAAPPKPMAKPGFPAKQQPAPAVHREEAQESAPAITKEEVATESAPVATSAEVPVVVAATAAAATPAAPSAAPANWPGSLPPFDVFCGELTEIFNASLGKGRSGAVSANIPVARCAAGYAVCTMDGHVHTHGAEGGSFSLQGAVWPLLFGLCAPNKTAEFVGKEYFADDATTVHTRAPNPLNKAGAIVLSALNLEYAPADEPWERLDAIAAAASALAGSPVGYSMAAYAKAKECSANAWANAYALSTAGNLPGNADVEDVANFFFQVNALQMTIEQAAVFAAAVANDGVSPVTKAKTEGCFAQVISMTSSMGVAHDIPQKLPSAGGESGVVLVFIPHVCGIAVFAPELGSDGISVAGSEFVHQIAAKYKFK